VDGADGAWYQSLAQHHASELAAFPNAGIKHSVAREPAAREPRAKDELYYSVKSILKHMPWVRTYYLVTMRPHKPWWWPPTGQLGSTRFQLVHHDEIVDQRINALPTFNSGVILSHIHNIKDLAEHFILFDDDCFAGQPVHKRDFFTPAGMPVARMQPLTVHPNGSWEYLCANASRMIQTLVGSAAYALRPESPEHVQAPLLKSQLKTLLGGVWAGNVAALKRFRSHADYALQFVVLGAMWAQHRVEQMPARLRTRYYKDLSNAAAASALLHDAPHMFVINERFGPVEREVLEQLFG
jgi:hypothetical protein